MKRETLLLMFALGLLAWACPNSLHAQTTKHQWTGTTPAAAAAASGDDAVVFLLNVGKYNAGTDRNGDYWLGRGGKWGTEAVLENTPAAFSFKKGTKENSTGYTIHTKVTMQGGSDSGALMLTDGTQSTSVHDSLCYYLDRSPDQAFTFTAVDGKTNVYTIVYNGYKMAAASNPKSSDAGKRANCANAFDEDSTFGDATDQWMLISLTELKNYFKQTDVAYADPAIATFLLSNPDIGRKDTGISNWKGENDGTFESLSFEYPSTPSTDKTTNVKTGELLVPLKQENENKRKLKYKSDSCTYTQKQVTNKYFAGNGFTDDDGVGQQLYGHLWSVNILGNGTIKQEFTPLRAGWYVVHVKAFCTEEGKAKLFASYDGATEGTMFKTPYAEASINTSPVFGDTVTFYQGDSLLKTGGYEKLTMIYVPASNDGSFSPITIGIQTSDATDAAWTCIDNFQLYYHGNPTNVVLLDEEETSIDYINRQNEAVNSNKTSNGDRQKSAVYMRREMNTGKWNSLVVPFDAPEAVIKATFGEGTLVSELKGATNPEHPNRIYFQEVKEMKAGTLYIVKPANAQPTNADKVESSATTENGSSPLVTFEAGSKYWAFGNVSFGQDDDYVADFTSSPVAETTNGGQVQFAGTYVNHGDALHIPANSYVIAYNSKDNSFEAGKWYYRTKGTKTKGFRGWLQVVEDENASAESVSFSINGVVVDNSTTEIEGLEAGTRVATAQDGVYNLNGQLVRKGTSTVGLAKGIYLIGGKKHAVK